MSTKKGDYRIDLESFSCFFKENKERFISFAYSYVRNKSDAEDILMESMIALWEGRNNWNQDTNLHALLLTIVKNKSLNYLAHEQVKIRAQENINTLRERELNLRISTLEACNPEKIFDSEIIQIVERALKKLPSQSRHIFILSRQKYVPNKRIAEQLGISVKSVEFHISKALKLLRYELKDYLISMLL